MLLSELDVPCGDMCSPLVRCACGSHPPIGGETLAPEPLNDDITELSVLHCLFLSFFMHTVLRVWVMSVYSDICIISASSL